MLLVGCIPGNCKGLSSKLKGSIVSAEEKGGGEEGEEKTDGGAGRGEGGGGGGGGGGDDDLGGERAGPHPNLLFPWYPLPICCEVLEIDTGVICVEGTLVRRCT